jgi:predicted metalloprotease with PDZ domain
MIRALLTAAAATLLLGAAKVPTVDYRLGATAAAGQPPVLDVELRFAGDADGETRLELPDRFASGREAWRYVSGFSVQGASAAEDGAAVRVLRHRPGAKVTVRYRVQTAYDQDPVGAGGNPYKGPLMRPEWFALLGEFVFAEPAGRETQPATFKWGRLPKGWKVASDLEHGRMGRAMTVHDVAQSISMGGTRLTIVERPIPGGTLRFATPEGGPYPATAMADDVARVVAAERAYWNDLAEPYFVGLVPLVSEKKWKSAGGTGRGDAFVLYATEGVGEMLRWTIAHEHTHTWIPARVGGMGEKDQALRYWFSEGFTDFFSTRAMLRADLATPHEAVERTSAALRAYDTNPLRTSPTSGRTRTRRSCPTSAAPSWRSNGTRTSAGRRAARPIWMT